MNTQINTKDLSRKFFVGGKPSAHGILHLQREIQRAIKKSERHGITVRAAKNGGNGQVKNTLTVVRNEASYLVLSVGKDEISVTLPVEEETYLARNIRTMETAIVQIFAAYPISK